MAIELAKNAGDNPHRSYHITHLRLWTQDKKGTNIVDPQGGLTVAFRLFPNPREGTYNNLLVKYGLSVCREMDLYNRKSGREAAMHRLDQFADCAPLFAENVIKTVTRHAKASLAPAVSQTYSRTPGDWTTWPKQPRQPRPERVRDIKELVFTGAGSFILDMSASFANERGELFQAPFVHRSIVRRVLGHAKDVLDELHAESRLISCEACNELSYYLNPDSYPKLT